mgnify:CR=1 FL=1
MTIGLLYLILQRYFISAGVRGPQAPAHVPFPVRRGEAAPHRNGDIGGGNEAALSLSTLGMSRCSTNTYFAQIHGSVTTDTPVSDYIALLIGHLIFQTLSGRHAIWITRIENADGATGQRCCPNLQARHAATRHLARCA